MPLVVNANTVAVIALRNQTIVEIINRLGRRPSTRTMSQILKGRGFHISHVQVAKHYRQIELPKLSEHPNSPYLLSTSVNSVNGEAEF